MALHPNLKHSWCYSTFSDTEMKSLFQNCPHRLVLSHSTCVPVTHVLQSKLPGAGKWHLSQGVWSTLILSVTGPKFVLQTVPISVAVPRQAMNQCQLYSMLHVHTMQSQWGLAVINDAGCVCLSHLCDSVVEGMAQVLQTHMILTYVGCTLWTVRLCCCVPFCTAPVAPLSIVCSHCLCPEAKTCWRLMPTNEFCT